MVISLPQIEVFLFILARILGLFIQAPIFSNRTFPAFTKTAFAIWISIVFWFIVPVNLSLMPQNLFGFITALACEVAIGFVLGFIGNTIFLAVQSAGEFIDLQMGLSVSQSFDPIFGASISIVGRMLFMVALMVFLMANGHHFILSVINQSFKMIEVPAQFNTGAPQAIEVLLDTGKFLWTTSLQLAGPIILVIFLSDFTFGIVSRVAPQVNVFMLGFQVKPVLGLLALLFSLPLFIKHISFLAGSMAEYMLRLLMAVKII